MSHSHYPVVSFAAVKLGPSQVASVGLLPKKGVVQVAYSTGTGGKTCSSISCSSASLAMLLKGAPAKPQLVFGTTNAFQFQSQLVSASPKLHEAQQNIEPKLLNKLPGGCTAIAYTACSNVWSKLGGICKHHAKQGATLLLQTMQCLLHWK